jgi:hypothetical protein
MGNSTVKLQAVIDTTAAQNVPNPVKNAAGYGVQLALDLANDVVGDLITQRFNWKWNSGNAPAFYTNSWQQDYPQLGNTNIAWLEDSDRIDINNTSRPKPIRQLTCRRQISRTSFGTGPISDICWMYNADMQFGEWPGAGVTFYPLIGTTPSAQNPIMSMIDENGNLLIVTGFGTTGNAAPFVDRDSEEGTTVADGSVTWTVVAPTSKGFRVYSLPNATGPVYKVVPKFQNTPPRFTIANGGLNQLLDPIPDDYERYFRTLYRSYCLKASANPADRKQYEDEIRDYLMALENSMKQGNNELDAYALIPGSQVVENIFPHLRNPQDPSQPY